MDTSPPQRYELHCHLDASVRPATIAALAAEQALDLPAAVPTIAAHPADRLLRAGLRITVSTDARTTADTTLDAEFAALSAAFGWTRAEEQRCQDNAARAAFAAHHPLRP
ncbi:hypothetical protein ACFO1B_51555 [Dactylosporangium siamense]|uniref:adenosine deaminase n=1 Tax=Dactylosporangium siamense TaxID=685454 RepID=A0A919PF96_9ACTN|nr:hypothetical protein [Dactylosporangium siamense]GIG43741.1 hypothetical protein Dsi01nite_017820 [Dactylosporangium siamense]